MTNYQYMAIIGSIWLAPVNPSGINIALGMLFMLGAIYYAFQSESKK